MNQPNIFTWNDVLSITKQGNPTPPKRVEKSKDEWKALLSHEQFYVTREHGTERAHSSAMCQIFAPGLYACSCCDTPLFDATTKFDSGTGWPSFTLPIQDNVVSYHQDLSYGVRIEVRCNVCDAHLGHVFPDGPAPTGLRYCINALSLNKIEEA
ncbi:MAG: peptide-methionine (R)-S-oxide reductase [Zetaproteobacteria bacterium CG2_30_46_52]|nr:MAG: peptide-methionine (R)-S-oxide reductase [Zetaproteobacteria bacterium CG2_30_46_52]